MIQLKEKNNNNQSQKPKRKFRKWVSRIILLFVLLFVFPFVVLCAFHLHDEDLTEDAKAFFTSSDIDPNKNFFVTWTGIHAPPEGDMRSFGQGVFDGSINRRDVQLLRFNDDDIPYKRYCERQDEYELYNPHYEETACYSDDDIKLLLDKNQKIISRLERLYAETDQLNVNMGGRTNVGYISWQDVIAMQGLLCRKWIGQSENGEGKQAIESWVTSTRAIKYIMNGQLNFVDQTILQIIYSRNIYCIPTILEKDTSLINTYGDQLIDILNFNYLEQRNVLKMLQAHGSFMKEFEVSDSFILRFFYQSNRAKNKYYNGSLDILNLSRVAPSDINSEALKLKKKYECSIYQASNCLLYSLILNRYFLKFEQDGEMFLSAAMTTAQQKATVLWIKAHMQNISQDEIAGFLQNTSSELFDPISNQPFYWDEERKSIYHNIYYIEDGTHQQRDLVYYKND
ncbi:MAG: hypothetical protein ACRBDI_06075 [Alphaproteobacteria bacterium]